MSTWRRSHKSDPAALALADRHYPPTRKRGAKQCGPPGRKVVLVTDCERAVWLSHWPEAAINLDGIDAFRCSIFRNEGAGLSSELIVAAMLLTEQEWGRPPEGWITWVDTRRVRSSNPGYCFQQAGWWIDHEWQPARGRRGKIRLRADALTSIVVPSQLELVAA